MRLVLPVLAIVLAGGCAGVEYRDNRAKVDANPLCASRPDRPGEPGPPECERTQETRISTESRSSGPIDFKGRPRDD